jgi:MFS transporter, PPP family, 3-phenylpropionic acid transporter
VSTTENTASTTGGSEPDAAQVGRQTWTLRGLNFSYYATTAVLLPFLPIYFQNQGFTAAQIGVLMTIGPFVAIFAQPFWGYISDRYNSLKKVIMLLWLLTILSSAGIFYTQGYSFAFTFTMLLYFFMLSSTPLLDSLSIKAALQANKSYGSIRLWGSIGFSAIAVSAGPVLSVFGGLSSLPYLYWSIWLLPLVLIVTLKDEKGPGQRISMEQLLSVLRNKEFLWFLLLVFLITVPHRMNDGLFSLYLQDHGGTDTMTGLAWALAAVSEIPTFALLSRVMHKFHELALLLIVALLYTLRWLIYGYVTDPFVLMFMQATHMITFAVFWLVAVQFAVRMVPEELRSTGQAMLSAVFLGVAGITGGYVGGVIKDVWGGSYMYYFGAVMTAIAAVLLLFTHMRYRQRGW